MNKLIDGLFEHKVLVRVLSVLTAILLWFIVLDNNNPMMNRTLSVPVSGNPEVLEDNNLRVIGSSAPSTVDIAIRGRRDMVNEVTVNDFHVTLDYGQLSTSGSVTLNMSAPEYSGGSNIRILSMSPEKVQLQLERITGIEFPVQVRWEGTLPEGYRAANIRVEPSTVRFEDKESLVNRIENVVVVLDAASLEKTSNLSRRVLVLDADGNSVSQFDGKNSVTVSFDLIRTLPVMTRVSGTPATDWFVTGYKVVPDTVQVLGKYEALTGLSGVQAADIVVEGKEGSFTGDLVLTVPEGFTLYGTKPQVGAEVQMEKLTTRDFLMPVERVAVEGMDPLNRFLQFADVNFTITLKGKAASFDSVTLESLSCALDASTLPDGESDAPVRVTVPTGFSLVGAPQVKVTIEAVTPPEEVGTVDGGTPVDGETGAPGVAN